MTLRLAHRSLLSPRTRHAAAVAPATGIGRRALVALYKEVALHPKPGLVTPFDNGAHQDMTLATFLRSISALRAYFTAIAALGATHPAFAALQPLGVAAEAGMLQATGGVNTHRGAIFNLGLLCAAAGACAPQAAAEELCQHVARTWGEAILASACGAPASHGLAVAAAHGAGGARREAAAGFPMVRATALPAYWRTLAATGSAELAAVEALFALMSVLEDTNVLWRGGATGLDHVRSTAAAFLAAGGVRASGWRGRAEAMARGFAARRLSPGGAADLLAVTLFLAPRGARPAPCA